MLQVLQNLGDGKTTIAEVPAPAVSTGRLLIQSECTLISAGTEKMLVEFGQAGWIGRAKAQPEKVKQVLAKIKTDGLLPTLEAVFSKLGEPLPLGYCNAGIVRQIGRGVSGFEVGDRVVSNGPHAGFVSVPQNLCAKIPESVSSDQAAFTVLASIGLQGVRLAEPTLGETIVVYGLGLIGIITVQLLRANGCNVIGIDINDSRLELARSFGAETIHGAQCDDIAARVHSMTNHHGADAVIITASAKTDEILSQSAKACRKKGRVVLVGVVGLNLKRRDFYEKEISFRVSCSYGPGRYDPDYEENGHDYPIGYVRWTEQRNFQAILKLLERKLISFESLTTHRFSIDRAIDAYQVIQNDRNALGVILQFPLDDVHQQTVRIHPAKVSSSESNDGNCPMVAAVIGAGNFTRATLMPSVKGAPIRWKYVVGRSSASEIHHTAQKFGVEQATTDLDHVLADSEVNLVFITTNHDSHARLVCQSLRANKHVFVEKPLALNVDQLFEIQKVIHEYPNRRVMVGFNRRFSPHTVKCQQLLKGRTSPLTFQLLMNAGEIPGNHWVHDPLIGGGRIIGEACHFLDWMVHVADSRIQSVTACKMGGNAAIGEDKMSITVGLEDGSVGSLCYFANGSKSYPKESLRVFSDNRVLEIDNFRITKGYGFSNFGKLKTARQEKGHRQQFLAVREKLFLAKDWETEFDRLMNVTLASFAAVTSANESRTIYLPDEYRLGSMNVAETAIEAQTVATS